jgi:hypothetical protein
MKKFTPAASLLAAMVASFGASSPAHASTPPECNFFYSVAQLTTSGFACYKADKIYSDFYGFAGIGPSAGFTFTVAGAESTFSGTGLNFTSNSFPISFNYGYKVTLRDPLLGQAFKTYNTNAAGSSTTAVLNYTKELSTIAPGVVTGPSISPHGTTGGGSLVNFGPGEVGPLYFYSTLTLNAGKIDQITDTLNQALDPNIQVPGPLPLLGAGAAFGFSRRLRSRIKQAA